MSAGSRTVPEHEQSPSAHPRVLTTVAASGTTLTCDLSKADTFDITLTGNVTLTFSNPPGAGDMHSVRFIFRQDGTGSRTVTWPASVLWAGGSAPTITVTATTGLDYVSMYSVDGGVHWLATVAQYFA